MLLNEKLSAGVCVVFIESEAQEANSLSTIALENDVTSFRAEILTFQL